MERLRDPNEAPKAHLFQDTRRIVLDWLNSDRLVCKDGTKPAQLLYRQLTEEVIDRLVATFRARNGLTESAITADELQRIDALVAEKFGTEEWLYRVP